ncbi:MAG: Dyp-type peroxidase [Nocardioides sp.]|nr:Dyp-type peroxidase [Nocardioides sp.]
MAGSERTPLGRRRFLGYVGSAAAGAAAGSAGGAAWASARDPEPAPPAVPTTSEAVLSPYGPHQPGIAAPAPRVTEVVALDLLPHVDRDALGRLLRAWTGDVEALTTGRPTPGDTEPWLAEAAGVTVTVGLGPGALAAATVEGPWGFGPVPPMRHDRLQERWSGGDLVLVVGAPEGTTAAHAVRQLVRDASPFARQRWRQTGSWNGVDRAGRPVTGRNLFGQVDGTGNPAPGSDLFDRTVWVREPRWAGGTTLVVRRITMDLDLWATLTREEQERAVGRRLDDGARMHPMPPRAHALRARPAQNGGARIFRKGANYSTGEDSGLVFMSFQASVEGQFVPVQTALDQEDALNEWTTALGSAVFAVLPGFDEGDWLGSTLLS